MAKRAGVVVPIQQLPKLIKRRSSWGSGADRKLGSHFIGPLIVPGNLIGTMVSVLAMVSVVTGGIRSN